MVGPRPILDFRDIRLNAETGAIFLLFIALVFQPAGIQRPVARHSVRRLCLLAWAMLLALGSAISNTPHRVDRCTARIPFLHFLYNNESVMNEFGHRHDDPAFGTFYSRLTLSELRQNDAGRGAVAGEILLRNHALADSRTFSKKYPASADPFLHETWAHLIWRDHYYATAWKYRESDPPRFTYHLTVALRENQILDGYFPNALEAAGGRWPGERIEQCAQQADFGMPYVSEVDDHLVTAVSESELWLILLALAGLIGWGYARWGCESLTEPRATSSRD